MDIATYTFLDFSPYIFTKYDFDVHILCIILNVMIFLLLVLQNCKVLTFGLVKIKCHPSELTPFNTFNNSLKNPVSQLTALVPRCYAISSIKFQPQQEIPLKVHNQNQ